MPAMLPKQTLVLGGARSGKSEFAERLVESYGHSKIFIATAQATDDEMQCRIEEHRKRRGTDWRTVEVPLEVGAALDNLNNDEIALFDCLTIWLSNLMYADSEIGVETDQLMLALDRCHAPVVTVSNEVGQGIVPENPLTRRFRDEQGRLNQRLAAQCDLVVLISAGLPLVLKGVLPEGFA